MKPRDLIVGLDVGSTKVCAVIAEAGAAGGLDVIGVGTVASRGLRKGVVVNIDSTVEAIKQAVAEAEGAAGVEVASVYAGVAGGHIRGLNSRGVVAVSGKDREVSAADVARAVEAARDATYLPAVDRGMAVDSRMDYDVSFGILCNRAAGGSPSCDGGRFPVEGSATVCALLLR